MSLNKQVLLRNLSNIPGWRTSRKIIVFESDDWGAIRMSSTAAYDRLKRNNLRPFDEDENRYLTNDSLASESDLSSLFEILSGFKDKNGHSAVFTVFSLVANPDFDKIKHSNYTKYYYEPFTETLKRYGSHAQSFELWKEGIANRLFVPQFHGREHLNVTAWLKALQNGNKDTLNAFEERVYGITPSNPLNYITYQSAFNIGSIEEIGYLRTVISEGLQLFEQLFGYKASVIVPTNGWFNNSLEEDLFKNGIKYIGTSKIQKEPVGDAQFKKRFHYLGQKNKFGQTYLTRNCFFEPSSDWKIDWIGACLKDIEIAFRWGKPAVISTHRVNYVGYLNPQNRNNGLRQLTTLLSQITNKWPDAEFLTSDELGKIISQ